MKAEASFKDALEINPKNYDIYAELGWLYKDLGKLAAAEASFKKALELEPRYADAYVGLGWLSKEAKRCSEAKELFEKALKLNPLSFAAYAELGWLYKNLGKLAAAEAHFKKAMELESKNVDACIGLGWLRKEEKRYGEARELFEKAIELNPLSCAAYAELGWLYKEQGKPKDAQAAFKKALELNPNAESACVGLAQLRKDQGNLDQIKRLSRETAESDSRVVEEKSPSLDLYKDGDTAYPRHLQIMIGSLCNINCIMCPQDHHLKTVLNNDILKKNIDWLRIKEILINGGEVLVIKSAKELFIWLTEKMQKKIRLITNGLSINREWAEKLVRGSEWIEISVNAATKKTHELINKGSDFERVIRNIKMLIDLKRRYSLKTDIRYHFTIIPENIHEVAQAIKFADDLGCDLIAYSFDTPNVENFLSQHRNIKAKIRDEVTKLANSNLSIKILRNQLDQLGLIEDPNPNLAVDDF